MAAAVNVFSQDNELLSFPSIDLAAVFWLELKHNALDALPHVFMWRPVHMIFAFK